MFLLVEIRFRFMNQFVLEGSRRIIYMLPRALLLLLRVSGMPDEQRTCWDVKETLPGTVQTSRDDFESETPF